MRRAGFFSQFSPLGLVLSLLGGSACNEILGITQASLNPNPDAGALPPSDEPGGQSDAGPTDEPCDDGALRCDDTVRRSLCSGGRWQSTSACAASEVCDPSSTPVGDCVGLAELCSGHPASDIFCAGARRISCSPDLSQAQVVDCASALHCQAGVEQNCALCLPGEGRCDGPALSVCADDALNFVVSDQCDSAALCDAENARCLPRACGPRDYECEASYLGVCNRELTGYDAVAQCGSAALCDDAANICRPAPCNAGQFRCIDAALEVCSADLTGFVAEDQCDSSALCDAQAGQCRPQACVAGTFDCDGDRLLACRADLTGYDFVDRCQNAAACDEDAGRCSVSSCDAGEVRCSGAELLVCNSTQSGFDVQDTCATAALCDEPNRVCQPPACDIDQYGCQDDRLGICNVGRTGFVEFERCGSAALCDARQGICRPPVCSLGEVFCLGAELHSCNDDLGGSLVEDTCKSAELCDAIGKHCDVCLPRSTRCAEEAAVAVCSDDGLSETVQKCGARTPFCAGGACAQCRTAADCGPNLGNRCQSLSCVRGECVTRLLCVVDPILAPIESALP
jgi:hypothetical protein